MKLFFFCPPGCSLCSVAGAERGVGSGAVRSGDKTGAANALGWGHAEQGEHLFPLRLSPEPACTRMDGAPSFRRHSRTWAKGGLFERTFWKASYAMARNPPNVPRKLQRATFLWKHLLERPK